MHFNSIKVQLEHIFNKSHISFLNYFNSIKVQLEQTICHLPDVGNTFQFHKGTIRTR